MDGFLDSPGDPNRGTLWQCGSLQKGFVLHPVRHLKSPRGADEWHILSLGRMNEGLKWWWLVTPLTLSEVLNARPTHLCLFLSSNNMVSWKDHKRDARFSDGAKLYIEWANDCLHFYRIAELVPLTERQGPLSFTRFSGRFAKIDFLLFSHSSARADCKMT